MSVKERIEEIRAKIAELHAELRELRRTNRRDFAGMVDALRNTKMTVAELAEIYKYSPGYIQMVAYNNKLSLVNRRRGFVSGVKPLTDDQLLMVDEYRNGATFAKIGESRHLTRERIRQIIYKHEKLTGELLPRKSSGEKVPRVEWRCEICGHTRRVTKAVAATYHNRCVSCLQIDVPKLESWISEYREAVKKRGVFYRIGLREGYKRSGTWVIAYKVYNYLVLTGKNDIINEIWRSGIPQWLQHKSPAIERRRAA